MYVDIKVEFSILQQVSIKYRQYNKITHRISIKSHDPLFGRVYSGVGPGRGIVPMAI